MALADYQPMRSLIPFRGGEVQVRGLSLDDIAVLINEHLRDVDKLFDIYDRSVDESRNVENIAQVAVAFVREAPALIAHLIALAADEPQSVKTVRTMSMPVQVEILKAIATLTFEEAGGYRKFFESLKTLLMGMFPTQQETGSLT